MIDKAQFVELAKIAQDSFESRRGYEWKINFSTWGALGALAYWSSKENVPLFSSPSQAYLIGGFILLLYLLSYCLIATAHCTDKSWKHYYLDQVEGVATSRPPPRKSFAPIFWGVHNVAFTAVLLFFVFKILLQVKLPAGSNE